MYFTTYVWPHPNDRLNGRFLVLVQGSGARGEIDIFIESPPFPAYPSEGGVVSLLPRAWSLHSPVPAQVISRQ